MGCRGEKKGKTEAAGFMLLEVLLATTILGLAYVAIAQNFSQSMRNIERLERNAAQLFGAQIEMEKHFLPANIDEDIDGAVFVEGNKYRIKLLTDAHSGKLATLSIKEL
jgi:type II secretory pathway pseudopilin PulG